MQTVSLREDVEVSLGETTRQEDEMGHYVCTFVFFVDNGDRSLADRRTTG